MAGDPDYTVGTLMGRSKTGHYYVIDVNRFRKSTSDVMEEMIRTGLEDGEECVQVITKDPGAAGTHFNSYLSRTLIENGLRIKTLVSSGWTKKLGRFLPFSSMCESGNVSVVRAEWNEAWFNELEIFKGGDRKNHDD